MEQIHFELPQNCFFCGKPITNREGNRGGGKALVVHSLDGNHENWAPDNKVPAHKKCHMRFHLLGNKHFLNHHHSEETKRKLSKKLKHYWQNHPSERQRMSNVMKGDKNPSKRPGVRKKISESLTGVKLSLEHRRKIGEALKGSKPTVGFSGHNFDHGKGVICQKCGKLHTKQ